jgi:hypothetical protein
MAKAPASEITILEISEGVVTANIIGTQPLIFNRMSEKAKRTLLLPAGRKTAADRAGTEKHDCVQEYRDSVYRYSADDRPTRLRFPAAAIKAAMATAALDLPGAKKSEVGRLLWCQGESVDFYGVPKLLISVVRSADINKTPDIRTRAIVAEWACTVEIHFVRPKLNATTVARLLAAGGVTCGIGDFRQEKGKGNYGQFRVCDPDDPDFLRIVETGGREAQDAALHHYECYDEDTREMMDWYSAEIVRRREAPPPERKPRLKAA